jgi:pimeloyl-ACP methyl ester carboxylesterase
VIDTGTGAPVVLIPGIQGRWEWLSPVIDAFVQRGHRVLSFSLGDVTPGSAETDLFEAWIAKIDRLLDNARVTRATVIGVSFGGVIAVRYAAHRPERVNGLVLVSTPPPGWRPDPRRAAYLKRPRLMLPVFAFRASRTLFREVWRARPSWASRLRFATEYGRCALTAPVSPTQMAEWVRAFLAVDIADDCRTVTAPTLVVTGEPGLDRVVPVETTLEYVELIDGARHVILPDTGHVGVVTKPERFAEIVDHALKTKLGVA